MLFSFFLFLGKMGGGVWQYSFNVKKYFTLFSVDKKRFMENSLVVYFEYIYFRRDDFHVLFIMYNSHGKYIAVENWLFMIIIFFLLKPTTYKKIKSFKSLKVISHFTILSYKRKQILYCAKPVLRKLVWFAIYILYTVVH